MKSRLAFLALAVYYAVYIWRLSFVLAGTRYFILFDDCTILLDYGRTLAQTGHLAWWPGGPTGGVSSLAWAWLASLAWRVWPEVAKTGLLIQAFNGVAWLVMCWFTMKSARYLAGLRAGWIALALVATCWPVTNMFVVGWEFSLVTLGLAMAYYYWLRKKWPGVLIGLVLAVITRIPMIHSTPALLKLTGYPWPLMATRGAWKEGVDLLARGFPVFLLALLGSWWFKRRLPMLAYGLAVAFSIAVGGDIWHGSMGGSRWVLSTLPLLVVIAALAIDEACSWFPFNSNVALHNNHKLWSVVTLVLCLTWANPTKLVLVDRPMHYDGRYQQGVATGLFLRDSVVPGTGVAVAAAGLYPWIDPTKRYCDLLGFNDRHIASLPGRRAPAGVNPLTYFTPGHNKFDPRWTIRTYKPEIVLQTYGMDDYTNEWEEALRGYVEVNFKYAGYDIPLMVRVDSLPGLK